MECEPEDWESIELERIISREKDPVLKEALEDMNSFLVKNKLVGEQKKFVR